jgi:hypothetical protein
MIPGKVYMMTASRSDRSTFYKYFRHPENARNAAEEDAKQKLNWKEYQHRKWESNPLPYAIYHVEEITLEDEKSL